MELGSYFSFENIFTHQECDRIINIKHKFLNGGVVDDSHKKHRQTEFSLIEPNDETDWIYRRIADLVNYVNNTKFNFYLDGRLQIIQIAKYTKESFYNWHVDVGPSPETCCRKLSIVVHLSSPTYEGGRLQFGNIDNEPLEPSYSKGSVTIFPSIMRHRVTPVTKGTRYTLVVWATGPSFK